MPLPLEADEIGEYGEPTSPLGSYVVAASGTGIVVNLSATFNTDNIRTEGCAISRPISIVNCFISWLTLMIPI